MKELIDSKDVFEVVSEFPDNYFIWNIGRHNFQYEGYIPLAETDKSFDDLYHVNTKTLKTMFVGVKFSNFLLKEAGKRTIDKKMFEQLKKEAI